MPVWPWLEPIGMTYNYWPFNWGFPRTSYIYMLYWPSLFGQDGWILAKFFFAFLWTSRSAVQRAKHKAPYHISHILCHSASHPLLSQQPERVSRLSRPLAHTAGNAFFGAETKFRAYSDCACQHSMPAWTWVEPIEWYVTTFNCCFPRIKVISTNNMQVLSGKEPLDRRGNQKSKPLSKAWLHPGIRFKNIIPSIWNFTERDEMNRSRTKGNLWAV